MNNIFRNISLMVAAGAFAVSCADYNETNNFTAEPDPTLVQPYGDLNPVKSYINRAKYPNMSLSATLDVNEYNKQELAHCAVQTNFNNVAFGKSLMAGKIINDKGTMNFLDMIDLLDHVDEIGGEVYGSPLAANANQPDGWFKLLTAPIEISVDVIKDTEVDYTTMETFTGTNLGDTKPVIVKNYESSGQNALKLPKETVIPKPKYTKVYIAEGFEPDVLGKYTITFNAKADKDVSFNVTFSDSLIMEKNEEGADAKKFSLKAGKWTKMVVETMTAADAQAGYVMISGNRNSDIYVRNVTITHEPDNHRPQTDQEVNDTIHYALNAWCDGFMKINKGRIKSFDLIDEAIGTKTLEGAEYYDLKHAADQTSTADKFFWQDVFGSENYAPTVSKVAREAFTKYGGNDNDLKFFISESGLEDSKKMESLKYWMGIWDGKGAKIDGINAKLNLSYSEDAATQKATEDALDALLDNLAATGKLIRLSNLDIVYKDATGSKVSVTAITDDQRQQLANFYVHVIKRYMAKIAPDKQAGLCKTNLVDTASDPVGLWTSKVLNPAATKKVSDWVRNANYKAFCDALSGE